MTAEFAFTPYAGIVSRKLICGKLTGWAGGAGRTGGSGFAAFLLPGFWPFAVNCRLFLSTLQKRTFAVCNLNLIGIEAMPNSSEMKGFSL